MRTRMMTVALMLVAAAAYAEPLTCGLTTYKAVPGLTATVAADTLVITWDGDRESEVRLRFGIDRGTPTIRDLAIRRKGGQWSTVAANLTPEFRVVTGVRRMTQQQLQIPFTAAGKKWVRFAVWDAAGNGAFVQPIKFVSAPTTAAR